MFGRMRMSVLVGCCLGGLAWRLLMVRILIAYWFWDDSGEGLYSKDIYKNRLIGECWI